MYEIITELKDALDAGLWQFFHFLKASLSVICQVPLLCLVLPHSQGFKNVTKQAGSNSV
jgi:hypothetical protein